MFNSLYPLKFNPIIKEKIWGGNKLVNYLFKDADPDKKYGESWEISGLEENVSVIANGDLAENNLNEMIEIYMGDLVGESVFDTFGLGFPLLIKFIDAAEDLSVQVHPDDRLAMERYGQNGKSELWYIIDAEENAGIYLGFQKGVTQEDYLKAVEEGTVENLLTFYPVKKGDAFFVAAGTVHAIGAGVLLTEIQQPSDVTYRIFDWNRLDEQGNSRELHVDEALDAIHFDNKESLKIDYRENFNCSTALFRSELFNINLLHFDKPIQKVFVSIDSFIIYICLEGHVHCFTKDEQITLEKGEVMLVPATTDEINLIPCHCSTILEIYLSVPEKDKPAD